MEKAYPGVGGAFLNLGGPMPHGVPSHTSDAVIERINKQNGFAGFNDNASAVDDPRRVAKPRYRVAAPSIGNPPGVGDASNKQNF
jgi:hypothetical protein